MNQKVKEYLNSLNFDGVKKHRGYILSSSGDNHVFFEGKELVCSGRGVIFNYNINGDNYIAKPFSSDEPFTESRSEVIIGEVLNDLNVPSVRARLLKHNIDTNCVLTKDVRCVPGVSVSLASHCSKLREMHYVACRTVKDSKTSDFFEILRNANISSVWKQFMSAKGRRAYIEAYMAGLLLSNQDMHEDNVFLYKDEENNKKYDGVILIDNEYSGFSDVSGSAYMKGNDLYSCFMKKNISYYTPVVNYTKDMTYPKLIRSFNSDIQAGVLDNTHIQFLQKLKKYDLSKKIRRIEEDTDINLGNLYDAYSRLWEYMQVNLEL